MTAPDTAMSGLSRGPAGAGAFAAARRTTASPENQADKSGQEDAKRQAWLREMERAQLAGWFLPTGREALRGGAAMKNLMISEPSRSLAAVAPHREFPYSTSNGEPRHMAVSGPESMPMDAVGASSPSAPASVQPHQMSSVEYGSASLKAPSEMPELMEQDMHSEASVKSDGYRFTATQYPAAGFLRGSEHPLLVASSAAAQELPALPLPASQMQVLPQMLLSSPVVVRWDPTINTQADRVAYVQKAGQEASLQEGNRVSNQGAQRNSATRLHSQWTSDGMTLWIGMDGTARQVELQAQTIVSTLLRSFNSQGQRLSKVVCNGTVVYDSQDPEANGLHLADFSNFLHQDAHIRVSADISSPNFQLSKEKQ